MMSPSGGHSHPCAGKLPKVNVQGTDLKTVTVFRYLGSQIESNATTDRDIEARLGAARTMFNQMYPLWISKSLSTRAKIKLKLCEVSVVTIARCGSESWYLTAKARKKLNGWNSRCLVTLTGRTHREEASTDTTSFDFVATIRYQRLNWLGQILRKGPGNHLKEVATTITLKEDGTYPEGSLFMDAPAHDDTAHLCSLAGDEKGWAKHVRDTFPECAKAAKTAKTANATNGGGSSNNDNVVVDDDDDDDNDDDNVDNDDDDNDDDDDDQAAPADKWTNGKLFHWDPFFGWTSGYH